MSLELSKLENVRQAAHGKTTARCPACAAAGGDAKGEHLVIYEDGKYGCVASPDDQAHRQKIHALAGKAGGGVPVPVRLSVQTFRAPPSQVLMDLGRFDRFSVNRKPTIPTAWPAAASVGQSRGISTPPTKLRIDEPKEIAEGALQEA